MARVPTCSNHPQSFLVYGNPLMDFQGASVAPEAAALNLALAQALQALQVLGTQNLTNVGIAMSFAPSPIHHHFYGLDSNHQFDGW